MLHNICDVDQSDGWSDIPDILDFLAQESQPKKPDPFSKFACIEGVVWGRDYLATCVILLFILILYHWLYSAWFIL